MKVIAHIKNDFDSKFGVPRQSGLITSALSRIIFEPEFRNPDALRGIEDFSHLWLLWDFSQAHREGFSPTVRPPMLGGNVRMGVFATRSPFRPNNIGLSCVRLDRVILDGSSGPELLVTGADLMNDTPILDIKPYLPFTDSHPEARGGFTDKVLRDFSPLDVVFSQKCIECFSEAQLTTLHDILASDPRPHYHYDPHRVYGFTFAGIEVHFSVKDNSIFAFVDAPQ